MNNEWLNLNESVAAQRLMDVWRVPRDVADSIKERLRDSARKDSRLERLQERIAYLESQLPPAPPEPERERTSYKSEWE